jgi:hypothetical protein
LRSIGLGPFRAKNLPADASVNVQASTSNSESDSDSDSNGSYSHYIEDSETICNDSDVSSHDSKSAYAHDDSDSSFSQHDSDNCSENSESEESLAGIIPYTDTESESGIRRKKNGSSDKKRIRTYSITKPEGYRKYIEKLQKGQHYISMRMRTLNGNLRSNFQELIYSRLHPIHESEYKRVSEIMKGRDNDNVLKTMFSIDITRHKFKCLHTSAWLNDEIINFYLQILKQRDTELCQLHSDRKPSYFFSSYFMAKLLEGGCYSYKRVKRWAKGVDMFAQDKIFVPINIQNNHWVLVVVYMQEKKIVYYDSFKSSNTRYVNVILQWLQDSFREKKNGILDIQEWKRIYETNQNGEQICGQPRQKNGRDCGVFVIMACDYLSDNLPLWYNRKIIPQWRYNIGAAVLRGKLNYAKVNLPTKQYKDLQYVLHNVHNTQSTREKESSRTHNMKRERELEENVDAWGYQKTRRNRIKLYI